MRSSRSCDKYGDGRVDAICQSALAFDVVSVKRVTKMLNSAARPTRPEKAGKVGAASAAALYAPHRAIRNPRRLDDEVSLRFLEAHRHVCVLGPVGVGNTFVASALGHLACRHGYNVKFARADETLRRLRQSRFDNSRDAEMIALTTVDLLASTFCSGADVEGGEQGRRLALPRTYRSGVDDRHLREDLKMLSRPSRGCTDDASSRPGFVCASEALDWSPGWD